MSYAPILGPPPPPEYFEENYGPKLLAIGCTLFSIAAVTMMLRIYVRVCILKMFGIDGQSSAQVQGFLDKDMFTYLFVQTGLCFLQWPQPRLRRASSSKSLRWVWAATSTSHRFPIRMHSQWLTSRNTSCTSTSTLFLSSSHTPL